MMPPNKEQRKRLQRWLDLGKKLRDHGPDLVERVPSPSTIFERYRNGTLIPHFHVGIRSSALAKNPQQLCVSLQAGRKRERFVGESGFGTRHPKITVSGYTHTDVPGVLGEDQLDLTGLVPTYEVVEHEKGVKLFDVEPTVRLVVLDDCRVGELDSGHSPVERSGEILTLTGNDELRRACAPEFGFGAPADEVASQVVESSAKVRERVADNEAPFGRRFRNVGGKEREAIRVRVEFIPELERWFTLEVSAPRVDASLEFVHVSLRPIEFVPTPALKFPRSRLPALTFSA